MSAGFRGMLLLALSWELKGVRLEIISLIFSSKQAIYFCQKPSQLLDLKAMPSPGGLLCKIYNKLLWSTVQ